MNNKNYILDFFKTLYILVVTFLAFVYLYGIVTDNMDTSLYSLLPYFFVFVFSSFLKVLRDKEKNDSK
ncbi:MAG: hypothetical protein ACTHWZ_01540 [Peptoniphilaceae bacterium]